MNRLLLLLVLLAVFAVMFAPALDVVIPHHDSATVPHAAQDDDCGCVCHVAVDAVVSAYHLEIHHFMAPAEHFISRSLPDPPPLSLDRPPELFS
jgi:hypothetical protein